MSAPAVMPSEDSKKKVLPKERYYRKQVDFFRLIQKIKLWPSRRGILHGIKAFRIRGEYAELVTHCDQRIMVRNSKRSRAARWLHNKWFFAKCRECRIPNWKLEKFSSTYFHRHWGSQLLEVGQSEAKTEDA